MRDGALGHLTVGAAQVTDQAFLQRLQQPAVVKVLPERAPLLVALSDKQITLAISSGARANEPERLMRTRMPVRPTTSFIWPPCIAPRGLNLIACWLLRLRLT